LRASQFRLTSREIVKLDIETKLRTSQPSRQLLWRRYQANLLQDSVPAGASEVELGFLRLIP
jgi:hypothetical protein